MVLYQRLSDMASRTHFRSLFTIIIVAVGIALIYLIWYREDPKPVVTAPQVVEPEFVEEGLLAFLESNGDTIRTISIEIADNVDERTRGLMYRSAMNDDQGMLFIFDDEEEQSFWMKNTKISLDILYVNRQLQIVTIYRHTQPYSESPIPSFEPAQYVVEVKAGFCDAFGVNEGDRVAYEKTADGIARSGR